MNDWLKYIAAFGVGLAVAFAAYRLAFTFVLSDTIPFSMTGFVGFVILAPMLLGAAVFGLVYGKIAAVRFSGADWLNGGAFTFAVTVMSVGLVLSRAMAQLPATILLIALLFIGGRVLLGRKANG